MALEYRYGRSKKSMKNLEVSDFVIFFGIKNALEIIENINQGCTK